MKKSTPKQALPPGYELKGYRLVDLLGIGGFGVTYLAEHATLGLKVAIKEYLPNEFAVRDGTTVYPKSDFDEEHFQWGLSRFLDEARTLAKFEHRNLVRVRDYFESNRTAYIVMDYEEGDSLDRLLARGRTLSESQLRGVVLPIVDGLRAVHKAGFLHRDIKPSNVYVRRSDESPVLLDFGAARQAMGIRSKSLTAVASAGYSPPEQYESEGEQGPWTDIYSLSALCFRAVTGRAPVEATKRINRLAQGLPDPLRKLGKATFKSYTQAFLEAVDQGLEVIPSKRPGSLDEWVPMLDGIAVEASKNSESGLELDRLRQAIKRRLQRLPGNLRGLIAKLGDRRWLSVKLRDLRRLPESLRERQGLSVGLGVAAVLVLVAAGILFASNGEPEPDTVAGQDGSLADEATLADDSVTRGSEPAGSASESAGTSSETVAATTESVTSVSGQAAAETEPADPSEPGELPILGGNAMLKVNSEPSDVEVWIDGQFLARTPPWTLRNLRAGAYTVELRHPYYETRSFEAQNLIDGEVKEIRGKLERATGKLTVLSEPEGAWIELDGRRLDARTPTTIESPSGIVELTLRAEGYRHKAETVVIPKEEEGKPTLVREWILEQIPYGTLTLVLEPPDAQVTLPEIEPAYRPGMHLVEGPVRVQLRHVGYRDETRTIEVSGDTLERIAMAAVPQPFTVKATPDNATIEIDNIAEPYRAGMSLARGDYEVRVTAPGYFQQEETVSHGSRPTIHNIELSRFAPFSLVTTPETATVEFKDASLVYRPGMPLEEGEYRLLVSAPRHHSQELTVTHGRQSTRRSVVLESFPTFAVSTTPSRATVEIDNITEPYQVGGMFLEPGEYHIRVSASGYAEYRETIRHGDEPTLHSVRLERVPGENFADELSSGGKGPEMVLIPQGRFQMGCLARRGCEDNETPVRFVDIRSFALSKNEVTFDQWDACVLEDGCNGYRPYNEGWGRGERPVINVSWEDAQAYVAWLSEETGEEYRLPTEAEWEYAARAETETPYSWGRVIATNQANCTNLDDSGGCGDQWEKTAPVGSFSANEFGLHDMHGNVLEWVEDCWNDSYRGAPTDGSARHEVECSFRVLRGGSWNSTSLQLRSAFRYHGSPSSGTDTIGFRVAQTLPQ